MNFLGVALWLFGIAVVSAALYGLHRLCLRLEERGYLYYKHKRSSSSAAGGFVAFQQMLEPQSQHVQQVAEQKRHYSDDEAPGDEDLTISPDAGRESGD